MTPLYKKLMDLQADKTDNRNIYMKNHKGITNLYVFYSQQPCGDKVYEEERTGKIVGLNYLIRCALKKHFEKQEQQPKSEIVKILERVRYD